MVLSLDFRVEEKSASKRDPRLTYRFRSSALAWAFMRAIDHTGGNAIAGYPTLEASPRVHVEFRETARAEVAALAKRNGGEISDSRKGE